MGTTTFHLIGYGIVAVMWVVAIFGLMQVVQSLRPYVTPHASAIFNAIREDWASYRATAALKKASVQVVSVKKQAPQMVKPVRPQTVRRVAAEGRGFMRPQKILPAYRSQMRLA